MRVLGETVYNPMNGRPEAIFEGYDESGHEVWITNAGRTTANFLGFTEDGWMAWEAIPVDLKWDFYTGNVAH